MLVSPHQFAAPAYAPLTEAQARRLIESNVIGTVVAHPGGQILEANDAFLRLVGYTRAEVQAGQVRWDTLTPPEYWPLDEVAIDELRTTGICSPWEKEYLCRDGWRVPVLLGMALLEQDPDTCVAFILDLTERKRAEAQIHALNSDLERRVVERTAELEAANKELGPSATPSPTICGRPCERSTGSRAFYWRSTHPNSHLRRKSVSSWCAITQARWVV